VFILLTASLSRETIAQVFTWPILAFVIVMLFVVRPLSIWIPTIGTELTKNERTIIGLIDPRGIVALSIVGYFDMTFMDVVFIYKQVCNTCFKLGVFAKKLVLYNQDAEGVLIVGTSSFSIALANYLKKMDIPALIVDSSKGRLYTAEKLGIDTHQGEILTEHAQYEVDFTPYNTILAMTIDSPYNLLVTQS